MLHLQDKHPNMGPRKILKKIREKARVIVTLLVEFVRKDLFCLTSVVVGVLMLRNLQRSEFNID